MEFNPSDTLSLPYMQGMDLSVQVMGWIKLSLPLLHRFLWVAILHVSGHQTWQHVWINLIVQHMCAVALVIRAISYLEPSDKHSQKLSHTLLHGV